MRTHECLTWEDEGIWTAHNPSVPGVYGLGETKSEAERDFSDALLEMLAYLKAPKAPK